MSDIWNIIEVPIKTYLIGRHTLTLTIEFEDSYSSDNPVFCITLNENKLGLREHDFRKAWSRLREIKRVLEQIKNEPKT